MNNAKKVNKGWLSYMVPQHLAALGVKLDCLDAGWLTIFCFHVVRISTV
jgi:hypothetical protein